MTPQSQSNDASDAFSELIAGNVLGNLSHEEINWLAEHQPLPADKQLLLNDLQTTRKRMEQQTAPPLSEAVRQRVLQATRRREHAKPQNWLIATLLMALALTGGELYRAKLKLAHQRQPVPSRSLQPGDRSIALHAVQTGAMAKAHGQVLIRPEQGTHSLRLHHLPQAPAGKIYRLWAVTPAGLKGCVHFLPDQRGHVVMTLPPQPTGSATQVMISLDPIASRDQADFKPSDSVLSGVL